MKKILLSVTVSAFSLFLFSCGNSTTPETKEKPAVEKPEKEEGHGEHGNESTVE